MNDPEKDYETGIGFVMTALDTLRYYEPIEEQHKKKVRIHYDELSCVL